MRIRLLGGFSVEVDGAIIPDDAWRLRRARTLVKLLALTPAQRLPRDRVIDLLWPGRAPAAAVNSLHQVLHVARRALASPGAAADGMLELSGELIVLHRHGRVDVDIDAFTRAAARALQTHDPSDVAAALAHYGGDLLPEDPYDEWVSARRDELGATHRALLVEHADQLAFAGNALGATAVLQQVLDADPLSEPAVRSLVRLLAASGRLSESLARYEQLRDALRETYGTDPDPQTRQLFRQLLETSTEAGAAAVAAARPPAERTNLAPALNRFLGRAREMGEVRRLLDRTRILTLTGTGGAGKTRLAEELGRQSLDRYPDGVWRADLVPVVDPRLLADTVAVAMGRQPGAGRDPVQALVAQARSLRALVVLDNCEHLLGACARLVTALLAGCVGITVLATSREALRVPGEITFRVPSLPVPDGDPAQIAAAASVQLFCDRAVQVRPDLSVDAQLLADVATICRRLDGIPLAIELAAARVAHLQVTQIAQRLTDALSVLGRGPRGSTRHATLRAALEWSHDLLAADEVILFRRLAVFTGDFSLAAAEAVGSGGSLVEADVLDCLGRLVDKSLVQTELRGPEIRYRLLETVRQFARERLETVGESAAANRAHCSYFLDLVTEYDPERVEGVADRQPSALDAENDNLRAALSWALDHDAAWALSLAARMWRFWLARGYFAEGQGWLERVLAADCGPSVDRSRVLIALAVFDCRRGRTDRLRALADAAVEAVDGLVGEAEQLQVQVLGGFLVLVSFDLDAADRIGVAVGRAAEHGGYAAVAAVATWLRAMVALFREDVPTTLRLLDECLQRIADVSPGSRPFFPALTVCMTLVPVRDRLVPAFEETLLLGQRVGAAQAVGYIHSARGYAARFADDYPSALDAVAAAAQVFGNLDDRAGLAVAVNHLGCIERDCGQTEAAAGHLAEALRLRREIGDRRGENLTWCNLGLLAAATGDLAAARRIVGEALAGSEAIDDAPWTAGSLLARGVVELYAGDRRAALTCFERALDALTPQGYDRLEAWPRLVAAELADELGESARASRHRERAAALVARVGCRLATQRLALPASPPAR